MLCLFKQIPAAIGNRNREELSFSGKGTLQIPRRNWDEARWNVTQWKPLGQDDLQIRVVLPFAAYGARVSLFSSCFNDSTGIAAGNS